METIICRGLLRFLLLLSIDYRTIGTVRQSIRFLSLVCRSWSRIVLEKNFINECSHKYGINIISPFMRYKPSKEANILGQMTVIGYISHLMINTPTLFLLVNNQWINYYSYEWKVSRIIILFDGVFTLSKSGESHFLSFRNKSIKVIGNLKLKPWSLTGGKEVIYYRNFILDPKTGTIISRLDNRPKKMYPHGLYLSHDKSSLIDELTGEAIYIYPRKLRIPDKIIHEKDKLLLIPKRKYRF